MTDGDRWMRWEKEIRAAFRKAERSILPLAYLQQDITKEIEELSARLCILKEREKLLQIVVHGASTVLTEEWRSLYKSTNPDTPNIEELL